MGWMDAFERALGYGFAFLVFLATALGAEGLLKATDKKREASLLSGAITVVLAVLIVSIVVWLFVELRNIMRVFL